jgi:hypothetical protein
MRPLALVLALAFAGSLVGCGGLGGYRPPDAADASAACAAHGGVRQISTDRYGTPSVVVCQDNSAFDLEGEEE